MTRARNFGQLAQAVRKLASVPAAVSREAAPAIKALIAEQFSSESDPYGNAWAPYSPGSIKRGRKPPLLDETGALKDAQVEPLPGAGISVTFGPEYAGFHQTGWKWAPARRLFPNGPLPATWRAALQSIHERVIRERLK